MLSNSIFNLWCIYICPLLKCHLQHVVVSHTLVLPLAVQPALTHSLAGHLSVTAKRSITPPRAFRLLSVGLTQQRPCSPSPPPIWYLWCEQHKDGRSHPPVLILFFVSLEAPHDWCVLCPVAVHGMWPGQDKTGHIWKMSVCLCVDGGFTLF